MAGSISWREYTADDGVTYAVRADESNANAFGTAGTSLLPVPTGNHQQIPKGLQKRYILASSIANPNIRRKFYVGSQATFLGLRNQTAKTITATDYPNAGATNAGVSTTWKITYFSGEKARIAPDFTAPDTGLTDGTVSQ